MRLGELLRDHLDRPGRRAVEFAVDTAKGIKVPDVVWLSNERWAQIPDDAEASPVGLGAMTEFLRPAIDRLRCETE